MTQQQTTRFRNQTEPTLEQGERLLDIAVIQPARGATSAGLGLAGLAGEAIAGIGAVTGREGSLANGFPANPPGAWYRLLCVIDRRVLFILTPPGYTEARAAKGASTSPRLLWQVSRSSVAGIERRPRRQLMARFRIHLVDGSSASVMTMRRRTIESLSSVLGAADPRT
jgi:hypothetical protein